MTPEIIARPGFWNVPIWGIVSVYVIGFLAIIICALGVYKSYNLWRVGNPFSEPSDKAKRSKLFYWDD
ncbi:MAG: hypothetical protein LUC43_00880 [Burkholderiales bacterium]|nr:hypothetical protein [Burkholderiales bacterium]